jgi:hypothetical protein
MDISKDSSLEEANMGPGQLNIISHIFLAVRVFSSLKQLLSNKPIIVFANSQFSVANHLLCHLVPFAQIEL